MKNFDFKAIKNMFILNPIVSDECEISPFYAINILRNKNHIVREVLKDDNKIDFIDYRAYDSFLLDENNMVHFVYDSFYKFWHIDFRTATVSHDYVLAKKDNPIWDYLDKPHYYDNDNDYLEW